MVQYVKCIEDVEKYFIVMGFWVEKYVMIMEKLVQKGEKLFLMIGVCIFNLEINFIVKSNLLNYIKYLFIV